MHLKQVSRVNTSSRYNKRYKPLKGAGFFSNLAKWGKKTGKKLLNTGKKHAKVIAPLVAKELGSAVVSHAGNQLLAKANQKGLINDSNTNKLSKYVQDGAKAIKDSNKKSKASDSQKLVADLISDKSADLLGQLMSRRGNGVLGFGSGVSGFRHGRSGSGVNGFYGSGISNFGSGLLAQDSRNLR